MEDVNAIAQVPPKHVQIADAYRGRIARGELTRGDQLPPVRAIAADFGVSVGTAREAVRLLAAEQLVTVRARRLGTVIAGPAERAEVLPPRLIFGPQERWGWHGPIPAERAEVITAIGEGKDRVELTGMADARGPHEHIAGIFRLDPVPPHGIIPVYRRTQLIRDPAGTPVRLEVSWFDGSWIDRVRDEAGGWPLASTDPLPSFGGAAQLISRHTGQPAVPVTAAFEARGARDDGRETTLLGIAPGTPVLAWVLDWQTPRPATSELGITEYAEYVTLPGRVVQFRYAVAS